MSLIGISLNLLLAGLLVAALVVGVRLNRRLAALREHQQGFASAVRDLDAAARRAEQGLADLRVATNEAIDLLADRIEKGRALAGKLEKLSANAPAQPAAAGGGGLEQRFGALLAATREARARPESLVRPEPKTPRMAPSRMRIDEDDDLFEDEPLTLSRHAGAQA